jgi:hypothetical protein
LTLPKASRYPRKVIDDILFAPRSAANFKNKINETQWMLICTLSRVLPN